MSEDVLDRFVRYIKVERGRSAHTVRAYRRDVSSLLTYLDREGHQLGQLDRTTLRGWLAQRASTGVSNSTLARQTSAVRTFTAWAFKSGILSHDPGRLLAMPKRDKYLPTVLRQDQAEQVLDAAIEVADDGDPLGLRDVAALELLYSTGIRVSELSGIDIDDIDLESHTVRVVGKGNKERIVPFGIPAAKAVEQWIIRGRPRLVTSSSGPALLLGQKGGRWGQRQIRQMVKEMTHRSGVQIPLYPHVWRHTAATHMLEGGADLRIVQEFLGHASLETTQVYTSVSADRLRVIFQRAHPRA